MMIKAVKTPPKVVLTPEVLFTADLNHWSSSLLRLLPCYLPNDAVTAMDPVKDPTI